MADKSQDHPLVSLVNSIQAQADNTTLTDLFTVPDTRLANAVRMAETQSATGIDLTKVHCIKTGQPIASLDEIEIERIIQYHGAHKLDNIAHLLDLSSGVSRIWVHTGPDALNKLETLDPRGFFCYCIGIALQTHHQHYTVKENRFSVADRGAYREFQTSEGRRVFRNSLVKAWYMTGNIPADVLKEANKKLRFFMYLDLHNQKLYKMPWHLMRVGIMNDAEYASLMEQYKKNKQLEHIALYDADKEPLLPEEFATIRGVTWIANVLERFLISLKRKMNYTSIAYAHLHTASAFRRGIKFNSDISEFEYMLQDVQYMVQQDGEHNMSLRDVIARSKRIMREQQAQVKKNFYRATGPITLNLRTAADGTVDTDDAPASHALPAPKPQQPKAPVPTMKLQFRLHKPAGDK